MNPTEYKRAFVAGISFAACLIPAPATAVAKPVPCSLNFETGGLDCSVRMHSRDRETLTVEHNNCGAWRHFGAVDASKRVALSADGHWIAPGVVRMRANGSPLGPLRVRAHIVKRSEVRLANYSWFPVRVFFTVDCEYGD